MNAIRVKVHIDSETLVLPEIRQMIGRNVEVIFLDDEVSEQPAISKGKFSDSGGKFPDFDEDAFWATREASKI